MQANIKTLLGQPYWSLRQGDGKKPSETARLLYPYLDGQLATKAEFNIKLDALQERFGLRRYKYKADRLNKLKSAIELLDGAEILGGDFVLHTSYRPSADNRDFVLIATRTQK